MAKAKVTDDLVHMIHRDYTPTALRLSPLQYRVLAFIDNGAAFIPDEKSNDYGWPAVEFKGEDPIRVHRTTYRALLRRKLVVKDGGQYTLSLLAVAALEVYTV